MSIVTTETQDNQVVAKLMNLNYDEKTKKVIDEPSAYNPSQEERDMISLVLKHFTLGNVTMFTPRVEFNDTSVFMRDQLDQLAWNTYQPNNGLPPDDGSMISWRSNAVRPVVRNKAISIAAHATARIIFPKIFAYDQSSDEQSDAAQVMSDLMDWAAEQSNYEYYALMRVIAALYAPASIGYTEYAEVYRNVKKDKDENGKWIMEPMLDDDLSGFRDEVVPIDQLYIENFFEPDIQKQAWLILRKVYSFDNAQAKYNDAPNFKHVRPGVQTLYNDANQSWYFVYDTNMRQTDVEEITYWNKSLDVKIITVNGVMMTDPDSPNPRNDKKYPFEKFGYELINARCFYYKSLAFKLQSDAAIVNTLYPMIIDGTYLNIMKPMVNTGGEMIASDVIVPGAVTTLKDPNADLRAISTNIDLVSGMNTLEKVEASLTESSADQEQMQNPNGASPGAYQISRIENKASLTLGLFVKMIMEHVKQYGYLRISDILQYLTIPEVSDIEDDAALVYKTFLLPDKHSVGRSKTRKITFDINLPDKPITEEEYMKLSFETLEMQGGLNSKHEIWRVNPELVRKLKYMITISPDLMNPMSEELESAYNLEEYDRLIQNPLADQEEALKLLLSSYKRTRKNPSKYIKNGQSDPLQLMGGGQQPQTDQNGQPIQGGQPQPAQQQTAGQPQNKQLSKPSARTKQMSPSPMNISPVAPSRAGLGR